MRSDPDLEDPDSKTVPKRYGFGSKDPDQDSENLKEGINILI
jgi:hypothetical protein